MKREDVPHVCAVLQAWAEGRQLQYQHTDWRDTPDQGWLDFDNSPDIPPDVNSFVYRWRIKPRNLYVRYSSSGDLVSFSHTCDREGFVKFIEVIE